MNKILRTTAAAASFAFAVSVVPAAASTDCSPGKPGSELTLEEAQKVYDCIKDALYAGYTKGDKKWIPAEFVRDYRDWTLVSRLPANPPWHGDRYLLTWVNDVGAEEYQKFLEERGPMPTGTVIAKESFKVSDKGAVKKGPLFIMQKADPGASPETDDWYYMMVAPSGKPVGVDPVAACSNCHKGNWGYRDSLGYPLEDLRVSN